MTETLHDPSDISLPSYPLTPQSLVTDPFSIPTSLLPTALQLLREHVMKGCAHSPFAMGWTYEDVIREESRKKSNAYVETTEESDNATVFPPTSETKLVFRPRTATSLLSLHLSHGIGYSYIPAYSSYPLPSSKKNASVEKPISEMGDYMAVVRKQQALRDPFAEGEVHTQTRSTYIVYAAYIPLSATIMEEPMMYSRSISCLTHLLCMCYFFVGIESFACV